MSTVKNEVSPAAAKRIVEVIRLKLYEYGLENSKEAKSMAIGVAAIVKRIVLEDSNEKTNVIS